jgi:hypothetical protein
MVTQLAVRRFGLAGDGPCRARTRMGAGAPAWTPSWVRVIRPWRASSRLATKVLAAAERASSAGSGPAAGGARPAAFRSSTPGRRCHRSVPTSPAASDLVVSPASSRSIRRSAHDTRQRRGGRGRSGPVGGRAVPPPPRRDQVDPARVCAQQASTLDGRVLGGLSRFRRRSPAREHVAAELQPDVGPIDGLPKGDTLGEAAKHGVRLVACGPGFRVVLWQEQARAQPDEPGRHAHPLGQARQRQVGRAGVPGPACAVDRIAGLGGRHPERAEGRADRHHALLDQGEHGQAAQVHVPGARLVQQRVERPLVAGEPQHGRVRAGQCRVLRTIARARRRDRGDARPRIAGTTAAGRGIGTAPSENRLSAPSAERARTEMEACLASFREALPPREADLLVSPPRSRPAALPLARARRWAGPLWQRS